MKKRFLLGAMLLGVVAVLLSALSLQTRAAQAAPSSGGSFQPRVNAASCGKWGVVPSPNGNGSSGLNSLAVISASAIWAVGNSSDPLTRTQTTLIEYWNGTQWQIVSNPNPSPEFNNFYGVAAISENDAWAVGFYANSVGIAQTLIEHWDGSTWSVVSSPNAGSQGNELLGVAAVSASDVWAVGFAATSNGDQKALIEHWNGHNWRVVPSPQASSVDVLSSVATVSANDVWAVGTSSTEGQTLIEHWNGSRWQIVPSPATGGELRGLTAASANDVWAVGDAPNSADGSSQALIEHWNGTNWQVVPSPQATSPSLLSAVAAVSATDVWVVGSQGSDTAFFQTLIEHWNGRSWQIVPSPSPGSFSTQLSGVAAVSAKDVWAVGYADSNTLVEHDQC
jgi:hypothetical protein